MVLIGGSEIIVKAPLPYRRATMQFDLTPDSQPAAYFVGPPVYDTHTCPPHFSPYIQRCMLPRKHTHLSTQRSPPTIRQDATCALISKRTWMVYNFPKVLPRRNFDAFAPPRKVNL